MNSIVSLKNVSFSYEESKRKVLKNINMEINEGDFVVITGPTGAGKTTLCEALNGVVPHFIKGNLEGEIIIDGLNTKQNPVYKLASKIGMVFQDPDTQLFGMTVEEDISFGPSNMGFNYDECMKRVKKSIEDLKVQELKDRKPLELSGGQKQSVSIAGVYAMLPHIIVFDEPTSMLDPIGKARVLSMIKNMNKEYKITVILVEHEMNEIVRYADKVFIMNEGEICLQGNVMEVFTQIDKLNELGLSIPQTIELGTKLKLENYIDEVPLNPEQMIDKLSKIEAKNIYDNKKNNQVEPDSNDNIAVEIKDVKHSYLGDFYDLKGINLKIKKGDFVAIIGQNGAGKTTLARNIIGLIKPNEGDILIKGQNIKGRSVAQISNDVGYVFQNPDDQIFKESVEEELKFGPTNLGKDQKFINSISEEILKDVGLEKYREVWPKYLSKGERQRLAMGAIIAMDPDIIIVDEPTTGQDWRETLWIMELLKKNNEKGKTIIIITHNMEIVCRYCKRVVVMVSGEILLDGSPNEVFTYEDELKKAYIKPTDITYIAQNISYMPKDIISIDKFCEAFKKAVVKEGE